MAPDHAMPEFADVPPPERRSSTVEEESQLILGMSSFMALRLMENRGKLHWLHTHREWLETRLRVRVESGIVGGMTPELAADIANYAAMLADKAVRK